MNIVKLNKAEHFEGCRNLFQSDKYMGVDINKGTWGTTSNIHNAITFNLFADNYLSDLNSFHAYGAVDNDGSVKSVITYYEAADEPAWYYTVHRTDGVNNFLPQILDKIIEIQEEAGRLKFYSLMSGKHNKAMRRFLFSEYNNERYGYFDEILVPAKTKCFYTNAWELLYKRTLLPVDTVMRCSYLKQEFRTHLPIGGSI